MNNERKMATIRQIKELTPIVGADLIETATVDGWKVVVKKGEYQVGDMCIYCEIDSWIPHTIAPFLTKEGSQPKVFNNVKGQRLKTVKLRGQISQGLILPISLLAGQGHALDDDVSETLGIQKWEVSPDNIRSGVGYASGRLFPSFIPKTSQQRVQNMRDAIKIIQEHKYWEVTEKLHGQSMTVYYNNGKIGVCSRNIELDEWIKHKVPKKYTTALHKYVDKFLSLFMDTNKYAYTREPLWEAADRAGVLEALKKEGKNLAIQGELVGRGVQSQTYGYNTPKFFVFDIFNITLQEYYGAITRMLFCNQYNLQHVPVMQPPLSTLPVEAIQNIGTLLQYANGYSLLDGSPREGVVFKSVAAPSVSFKVVSNEWLLKERQ